MGDLNKTQHILNLSKELLDDIELDRIAVEQMVMKATRLARYVGSEEIKTWLQYEVNGYEEDNGITKIADAYMVKTGRWTDRTNRKGYVIPIAQISAIIRTEEVRLQTLKVPNSSGEWAGVAVSNVLQNIQAAASNIGKYSGIRSKVIGLLHNFVSSVYYEQTFDKLSESLFESFKSNTDMLITEVDSEALTRIPLVMDRLAENDTEAASQALSTCRRIIDTFADAVMPASDETYEIDGNRLSLKKDKTQNRINVFIDKNCESKSRKKRFKQNLSNLYDRVSTGVHNEVNVEEAKALFLNTYLLIGEILNLNNNEQSGS